VGQRVVAVVFVPRIHWPNIFVSVHVHVSLRVPFVPLQKCNFGEEEEYNDTLASK
jgi:hypothetical protein